MDEPEATKARMIAAAERLFAQGGEEATSLRAITREARVNVAAVHYHFGGRDALLREVLDRQVAPINARRVTLLDAAVAEHGRPVPVRALLEAFLRPDLDALADLRRRHVRLARFMGRAYTQPSTAVASFVDEQFGPLAKRLYPLLEATLPEVDVEELRARMRLVVAIVTTLFATATAPGGEDPLGTDDVDLQLDRLVTFLTLGLTAPTAAPDRSACDHVRRHP